jgi:hypothetical protein
MPEEHKASQKKRRAPPRIQRINDLEKEVKELTMYWMMYMAECQKKSKLRKEVGELKPVWESQQLSSSINLTTSDNLTTADQCTVTESSDDNACGNDNNGCDATVAQHVQVAPGLGCETSTVNCNGDGDDGEDGHTGTGIRDINNNVTVSQCDPKLDHLTRVVEQLFGKHKGFSNCQMK